MISYNDWKGLCNICLNRKQIGFRALAACPLWHHKPLFFQSVHINVLSFMHLYLRNSGASTIGHKLGWAMFEILSQIGLREMWTNLEASQVMGNIFHIDRRGKGRFEAKLSQYSRRKLSQLVFTAGQKLSNRSSRVSFNGSVRAMVPEDGKFPHPAIAVILSSLPLVPYHWCKVWPAKHKGLVKCVGLKPRRTLCICVTNLLWHPQPGCVSSRYQDVLRWSSCRV